MLKSDNLDALLSFYRGLMTGAERSRFAGALLQRLDGKKGYLDVSCFRACPVSRFFRNLNFPYEKDWGYERAGASPRPNLMY